MMPRPSLLVPCKAVIRSFLKCCQSFPTLTKIDQTQKRNHRKLCALRDGNERDSLGRLFSRCGVAVSSTHLGPNPTTAPHLS